MKRHFEEHGIDTITYIADPSRKSNTLCVLSYKLDNWVMVRPLFRCKSSRVPDYHSVLCIEEGKVYLFDRVNRSIEIMMMNHNCSGIRGYIH